LLPVILFIAFWVILALIVFFVAGGFGSRGGRRAAGAGPVRRSSRLLSIGMIVTYVGLGIAVPVLFLHGNHANASQQIGGVKLTRGEKSGRELFAFRCGFCHTLAAANAYGKVGPNLDKLRPSKSLVTHTINYGCLPNAPTNAPTYCLGYGVMPAGILQSQDAQNVASFVAKVAGRE
jgi:mono/diheme cytochrome c family protein